MAVHSGGEQSGHPLVTSDLDQDVLGVLGQPGGVGGVVSADGLEQGLLVLPMEGGLANQHLVQQHAERPPVHRTVVLLAQQDLHTHTHTHTHTRTHTHTPTHTHTHTNRHTHKHIHTHTHTHN